LTGKENIELISRMNGKSKSYIQSLYKKVADFSELDKFINEPVKNYSQGMYLRLVFSLYIHLEADIIVIDEILSVGDGHFRKKCADAIRKLQDTDKTLIVVSHDFNQINALCNKCALMENGEIIMFGSPQEIYHTYIESIDKRKSTETKDLNYEDDSIKLNHICINGNQVKFDNEIYVNEELKINFNIVKKKREETIIIHINFYNEHNQLIAWTSNIFGLTENEMATYLKDRMGVLNITVATPAFLFNVGNYIIRFAICKYSEDINLEQSLMRYEEGIHFQVNEINKNNIWKMNISPIKLKVDWKLSNP
jgi:ABC-2 type transport system ATP-binding protein